MNKHSYPASAFARRFHCPVRRGGLLLAATILIVPPIAGCNIKRNEPADLPPPDVTVAKPVQQSVTLYLEENGRTEPVEEAEVRSRVSGYVEEIKFQPGQKVKEGDELYLIETDFYQAAKASADAAVESAKAAVSVAEASRKTAVAEVEKAKSEFEREKRLLESNAGSQATFESAKAAQDSATANEAAAAAQIEAEIAKKLQADAALEKANLDLRYCVIRAPLDGRVSKTDIKKGNLVDLGLMLTSVVDQRKIFANFSISDRKLLELVESRPVAVQERNTPEGWSKVPVYLRREIPGDPWIEGRLEYVDQEGIDEATGTFGLRALFDNAEGDLMPGMFVMVRLPTKTLEDAILIPERAISRNQLGEFLLIVGPDNAIERREVTLGPKLDGWVVITSGLEAGDRFVLDGLQRARPGKQVTPTETDLTDGRIPLPPTALTKTPQE